MKKSIYIYATVALSAAFLVASTVQTHAQRHRQNSHDKRKYEYKKHEKRYIPKDKAQYKWDKRNDDRYNVRKKYHNDYQNEDHRNHQQQADRYSNKKYHRDYHGNHYYRYHTPHNDRHSHYEKHKWYRHRTHGVVITNFYRKSIIVRHHHRNYYYVDGYCYDYLPGIGYVVIESPRNMVVRTLPHGCKQLRVGGNVYFSTGNLYFQSCRGGYQVVPRPAGLHISINL